LRTLGVGIALSNQSARIKGNGCVFPIPAGRNVLFLGNSGTSFRFLLSVAVLGFGEWILKGSPRMHQRPVGNLVRCLNALGGRITHLDRNGYPPVHMVSRGLKGGRVCLRAEDSSQYVSSLLLAAPCAEEGVDLVVDGSLVSRPYIELTLDVMESFGVRVVREGYRRFRVPPEASYEPRTYQVEGDASSAAYFWAAAAVSGQRVRTKNIHPFHSRQGDMGFLQLLERMGCGVELNENHVTVNGGILRGVDVDMGDMPDMVPTLAAVALFCEGRTVIRNVPHLRVKESDRLAAVSEAWRRMGARVEEQADGLVIHGGHPLRGAEVDPHDDHRMAMSLAVAGLRVPGLRIRNKACVKKSFPDFWNLWASLQQ
jgi:3-phosphoshikimate 1-carboxyvinyltransferase